MRTFVRSVWTGAQLGTLAAFGILALLATEAERDERRRRETAEFALEHAQRSMRGLREDLAESQAARKRATDLIGLADAVHAGEARTVTRKGLATALFQHYGSVQRGVFRPFTLWLQDADDVLAIAKQHING